MEVKSTHFLSHIITVFLLQQATILFYLISLNHEYSNVTKRKIKPPNFPEEEGYNSERLNSLKNKRTSYIGQLSKVINEVTNLINENSDFNDVIKCNERLEEIINKIRKYTTKLIKVKQTIKKSELS